MYYSTRLLLKLKELVAWELVIETYC
jgi:hypothetical protein